MDSSVAHPAADATCYLDICG